MDPTQLLFEIRAVIRAVQVRVRRAAPGKSSAVSQSPIAGILKLHARHALAEAIAMAVMGCSVLVFQTYAVELTNSVSIIPLPPLTWDTKPARAHTQGLEIAGGSIYVSARLDELKPGRALLLRTEKDAKRWDIWDITPSNAGSATGEPALDHPGGMQFDGRLLWIPIAASQRGGRSLLCAFDVNALKPNRPAKPVLQHTISDHIGALAVSRKRKLVVGASWDTERVYICDLNGNVQRMLRQNELEALQLGAASNQQPRSGVAVQDWKFVGGRMYASGLYKSFERLPVSPRSRLLVLTKFPGEHAAVSSLPLELYHGTELAAEGMAVADNCIYFLPEDLRSSNRLFSIPISALGRMPKD